MKKVLYCFIFILVLISFVSAIKISPTQQILYMNQYETNCTNIWVLPNENFTITSKWSLDGQGDLSKYSISKEKIGLKINYSYESNGKYEICFTPNRGGNFSGIIYFYSEETMIEIGSWIDLRVRQIGTIERVSMITARAIEGSEINTTNIGLVIIFILLLIILVLIVRKYWR